MLKEKTDTISHLHELFVKTLKTQDEIEKEIFKEASNIMADIYSGPWKRPRKPVKFNMPIGMNLSHRVIVTSSYQRKGKEIHEWTKFWDSYSVI